MSLELAQPCRRLLCRLPLHFKNGLIPPAIAMAGSTLTRTMPGGSASPPAGADIDYQRVAANVIATGPDTLASFCSFNCQPAAAPSLVGLRAKHATAAAAPKHVHARRQR